MDLTQAGADDATVVSPSNTDDVIGDDYLVTDVSYDVVSEGYRVDMPVISIRCRDGDGNLATHTVDGFRPSFCIEPDDLRDDVSGVCNDRRVLGIEANFDDPFWYDFCNLSDSAMPELVAKELTANSDAVVSHVDEVDAPRETLDEDELVRIIVREPGDVSSGGGSRTPLRDEFEPTYEADVPFVNRFLIETEIYQGMAADPTADMLTYENWDGPSDGARQQDLTPVDVPDIEPRMCIFDIEVAMEGKGFPEPQRASQPINAITAYDSYRGEYIVWGLEHEDWSDDMAATLSDDTADRIYDEYGFDVDAVRIFSDESNLLEDFHDWILDCDPDIITGWNSDDFDVPYIIQRSYNVSALGIIDWSTSGSPGVWSEEYNGNTSVSYSITGRSTLDMLEAYKKTQFRDLKSYSLEYVAQEELGRGKSDIPADKLDEAWRSDPVKFLTYNARDVQAVVEIEAAAGGDGLIALYENLRSVTGALYDTCNNNGPMLDMLFLRRAYEAGIALPTNEEPEEGKYHGARVFDVKPGLHANCVYPDLSSLYPSLFSMLNLGKETIIGDRDALEASDYDEGDVFKFPVDRRDFAVVPKGESFVASPTEPDRVLGPDEHWIDTDQYKGVKSDEGGVREMFDPRFDDAFVLKPDVNESFIRSTIDELIELKYNYTGSLYSAVKRVTNCFSDDHEVQTPDGVVPIKDLRPGDEVYSYDPMTGERTVSKVKTTWHYPDKSQNLIHLQSQQTDLKVTPKHRIICKIDGTELELTAESVARRLENGEDIEIPIVDGSPHANGDCLIAEDVSWDRTHTGVFCVEVVDTNTLIVGRNDTFQVASNSVYGVFGDSESGGKGFRLFHNQVAEGITLAGRQVITHTAEEFTEYLQSNYDPDAEVVGGDTDSAVSSIPNAPDFDTALEWAHDAVGHVEESYADFAQEKYWLGEDDDNRLAVDLESLASQLFFMRNPDAENPDETGVQKRYAQHVIWDEDDGWLDLPDPDDTEYDVADDPDDRSKLKVQSNVRYDDYMGTGTLKGRDPQGDIEITGFEYVRSDAAQVTKDTQARIFTDILLHDTPRDRIEPYLNDIVDQIRAGEYDIADLARPKGMSNPVDEYGWTPIDELDDDEIDATAEQYDGKYTMTPGPTYRGVKYANDHFAWEDITPGTKPQKIPIEKVRGNEYPPVYEYDRYPEGDYPESPEVGSEVDAIAMEAPERLPEQFLVDYEDIIESALKDRLEQILLTVGLKWDDITGVGEQSSLGDWG